jgi:hypothetical protein
MGTDVMVVLYYRSIQAQRSVMAMILSFVLTIIPLFVVERGISMRMPLIFLSYALGAAFGTMFGMAIRI